MMRRLSPAHAWRRRRLRHWRRELAFTADRLMRLWDLPVPPAVATDLRAELFARRRTARLKIARLARKVEPL